MSFKAYLTNIQIKTGKTPEDFKQLAEKKGFTQNGHMAPGIKATQITNWLKEEFDLGHGHAMAVYALLKGLKDEGSK
jgi:hypothetical protein